MADPGIPDRHALRRRAAGAQVMRADADVVGGLPADLLRSASDQRLVEHVRASWHRTFEALFDRHQRAVLSFCARSCARVAARTATCCAAGDAG